MRRPRLEQDRKRVEVATTKLTDFGLEPHPSLLSEDCRGYHISYTCGGVKKTHA